MSSVETGYAQALIRAAGDRSRLKLLASDLATACDVIHAQPAFFLSPRISARTQADMVRELFTDRLDALIVEFLCLLAQRKLLRAVEPVRRNFDIAIRKLLGEMTVQLRIAYPMDDALLQRLKGYLIDCLCLDAAPVVHFRVVTDASLLGGFEARCNGRLVDASLKTRLGMARLMRK